MLNRKVVVLAGMARGGTNIVWNILQSHPDICAPPGETGQIFRESLILRLAHRRVEHSALARRLVDAELCRLKLRALRHEDNRFKTEHAVYTRAEVRVATLCLKSVNEDIDLTETLRSVYPDLYFIGLTRNGYAVAEGVGRRGGAVTDAARLYAHFASRIDSYSSRFRRLKVVRFEDVLEHPFEIAADLFSFLELRPTRLDKLRLKSKSVTHADGQRRTRFGEEDRKYWLDRESIRDALDRGVTDAQLRRLSPSDRIEFDREAGAAMRLFGYLT
jgi:hypothetical protein